MLDHRLGTRCGASLLLLTLGAIDSDNTFKHSRTANPSIADFGAFLCRSGKKSELLHFLFFQNGCKETLDIIRRLWHLLQGGISSGRTGMPLCAVLRSLIEVSGAEDPRERGGRLCCGSGFLESGTTFLEKPSMRLFPRLCIPFRVVSIRSFDRAAASTADTR